MRITGRLYGFALVPGDFDVIFSETGRPTIQHRRVTGREALSHFISRLLGADPDTNLMSQLLGPSGLRVSLGSEQISWFK